MPDNLRHAQYGDSGNQIDDPQKIFPTAPAGEGQAWMSNAATNRPCSFIPCMPLSVAGAFTGTQSTMMTSPGTGVVAVAPFAINLDVNPMTVDACSIAVTDRNDLSKTVPYNNGVAYNVAAGSDPQKGFNTLTWEGGNTSLTLPAATSVLPSMAVGDKLNITELARVDDPTKFPLFIVRQYFNARTLSVISFASAAEVDNFNADLAPYEFYQVAQATVDGATPATAATFTNTWALGASTQTMRIFGLQFWFKNGARTFVFCGESTQRGSYAAGNTTLNGSANVTQGWVAQAMKSLANKDKPVGWANFSIAGDSSTNYLARMKVAIDTLQPTDAPYQVYTTNDNPTTPAIIRAALDRGIDHVDFCKKRGVNPLIIQAGPQNRPLLLRLGSNDLVSGWKNSLCNILDVNTPVYSSTNSGNAYWITGTNYDLDHANRTGHNLQGAFVSSQLKTYLGG